MQVSSLKMLRECLATIDGQATRGGQILKRELSRRITGVFAISTMAECASPFEIDENGKLILRLPPPSPAQKSIDPGSLDLMELAEVCFLWMQWIDEKLANADSIENIRAFQKEVKDRAWFTRADLDELWDADEGQKGAITAALKRFREKHPDKVLQAEAGADSRPGQYLYQWRDVVAIYAERLSVP